MAWCVEVSRDCGIGIGVLWIIDGLSMIMKCSRSVRLVSPLSYVLLITFFALNHINQVGRGTGDVLLNLSCSLP